MKPVGSKIGPCPEEGCTGEMVLRDGKFGLFYSCTAWPECDATHGAHKSGDRAGEPLGSPADKETKQWRMKAHDAFDGLWKKPTRKMSRKQAYRWMQDKMCLPEDEAHIGKFDISKCKSLIDLMRQYWSDLG